jgi:hypothetical protein
MTTSCWLTRGSGNAMSGRSTGKFYVVCVTDGTMFQHSHDRLTMTSLSIHSTCFSQKGKQARFPPLCQWRQSEKPVPDLFSENRGNTWDRKCQEWRFCCNDGCCSSQRWSGRSFAQQPAASAPRSDASRPRILPTMLTWETGHNPDRQPPTEY